MKVSLRTLESVFRSDFLFFFSDSFWSTFLGFYPFGITSDPRSRTASLLGAFPSKNHNPSSPRERAILLLEKTHFNPKFYEEIGSTTLVDPLSKHHGSQDQELQRLSEEGLAKEENDGEPSHKIRKLNEEEITISSNDSCLSRLSTLGQNDIYTWLLGWKNNDRYKDEADFKINMIRPVDEKVRGTSSWYSITKALLWDTDGWFLFFVFIAYREVLESEEIHGLWSVVETKGRNMLHCCVFWYPLI